MKKLLTLFLLLLPMAGWADDKTTLVVELTSGKADTYTLASSPTVAFSTDRMAVTCDGLVTDYAIKDVKNWHFADGVATAVETPVSAAVRFIAPGVLAVSGTDVLGATVTSLAGQNVMTAKGNSLTIDLSNQAAGVYLVTINKTNSKQTIKIIKN